jgi:hypothetical protein
MTEGRKKNMESLKIENDRKYKTTEGRITEGRMTAGRKLLKVEGNIVERNTFYLQLIYLQ